MIDFLSPFIMKKREDVKYVLILAISAESNVSYHPSTYRFIKKPHNS